MDDDLIIDEATPTIESIDETPVAVVQPGDIEVPTKPGEGPKNGPWTPGWQPRGKGPHGHGKGHGPKNGPWTPNWRPTGNGPFNH